MVHGTVLRPREDIGAGVVLVAGSGPTDRDWNTPLLPGAGGSGKLLAEALAAAGIASLRYDKVASSPDAVEQITALGGLTMRHHTAELAAAVRVLSEEPSVDRVFALGNSEGTLHVLGYALSEPAVQLAGAVLVAPPGRPVGEVGRAQLAAQAAPLPDGEALLALYDEAVARFVRGEPAAPDPTLPEGVQLLLRALESPLNLPFARELWLADAASLLERVELPVLVVIGKQDVQVDWRADGELLRRAAAGRPNVAFSFPEHANHVLGGDGAALDPEATATIVDWLRRHSAVA